MTLLVRTVVGVIVESGDGKILLGMRAAAGVYPGTWQLPGGGAECGERLDAAARREVLEETGLDLSQIPLTLVDDLGRDTASLSGVQDLREMRFHIFHGVLPLSSQSYSLQPNAEFEHLQWFERGELDTLELAPAGRPLFERLGFLPR